MNTSDDECAAIATHLETLKKRPKLSSRKSGHIQHKIFLNETERRGLSALRATCSLSVGRVVSMPLVTRLALDMLAERCRRSLTDPVETAKLRADLLAVRDERQAERGEQ